MEENTHKKDVKGAAPKTEKPQENQEKEQETQEGVVRDDAQEQEPAKAPAVKKCRGCGRELPLSEFGTHNRAKDGLKSVCRECAANATKDRAPRCSRKKKGGGAKSGPLAGFPDEALVAELRTRGWDVRCSRTVTVEL